MADIYKNKIDPNGTKRCLEVLIKEGATPDLINAVLNNMISPTSNVGRPRYKLKRNLIMDHFLVVGRIPCKRPTGSKGRLKKNDIDSGMMTRCAKEVDDKLKKYFERYSEDKKKYPVQKTSSLISKLLADDKFRSDFDNKLQIYNEIKSKDSDIANIFIRAMI